MNEIHVLCKTYGVLPSEILKLEPREFTFNLLVLATGIDTEIKDNIKWQKKRQRS